MTHETAFPFGSFELCQEVAAGIPHAEFLIVIENSIAGGCHNENVAVIDRFLRCGAAMALVTAPPAESVKPSYVDTLTPREIQVLRKVANGATKKEIATDLGVAVSTIERHLVNL